MKRPTIEYLSVAAAAARAGVAPATWRRYCRPRRLPDGTTRPSHGPAPDIRIGQTPGWLPETVDAWLKDRPGRGWRSDLADGWVDGTGQ